METSVYHIPALLEPSVEALDIRSEGIYADATFGGGGHSRAILSRLGPAGHLYGFDMDLDARGNVPDDSRFTFVRSNFRYMENFLRFYGQGKIDGIIADLGVSFHHFDDAERGFSFRYDAPLDMRMNRQGGRTAADILNSADREQLMRMFRTFTDLKRPDRLADAILRARETAPLLTTARLVEAVTPLMNPRQQKKDLSQVFQALRIETNGELDSLRHFLESTVRILRPGGRLAVLTYHSIEDRMVKNFMRSGNAEGKVEKDFYGRTLSPWLPVIRGAVVPSQEEIENNPRARSARLRAVELIQTPGQE